MKENGVSLSNTLTSATVTCTATILSDQSIFMGFHVVVHQTAVSISKTMYVKVAITAAPPVRNVLFVLIRHFFSKRQFVFHPHSLLEKMGC